MMTESPLPPLRQRTPTWIRRMERRITAAGLRMLRVRRGRERVARGFALGLVINFIPSFGFGVLISGFVARIFGGHFGAGIIGGASLTFFWPVLFYLNIRMGDFLLGLQPEVDSIEQTTAESFNTLMTGKAFIVGTAANTVLAGLATYGVMLLILILARRSTIAYLRRRLQD